MQRVQRADPRRVKRIVQRADPLRVPSSKQSRRNNPTGRHTRNDVHQVKNEIKFLTAEAPEE